MKKLNLLIICFGLWTSVFADEILTFSNENYKSRYYDLLEELRCLVCQNQNLADSDAGLAGDLKSEVFNMVEAGSSDAEIKSFLTLRYGDFILYKPPFSLRTAFLWLGPFVLLLCTLVFLFFHIKQRQLPKEKHKSLSNDEKETLSKLLSKDNNK